MQLCRVAVRGVAILTVVGVAGVVGAQTLPTVVYSTIDGSPTNTITVPGIGARVMSSYDGLHRSPDGQRFILIANLTGDAASNRVIIAGTTSPVTGQVIVRRGESIPNYSTRTVNVLGDARINDAGQFVFWTNTGGSGALSLFFLKGTVTPTLTYGYVMAGSDPVPGMPGFTFTGFSGIPLLDNTGRWGFQSGITNGTSRAVVYFDGQVIALVGDAATAPTTLPGSPSAPWGGFLLRRVFVDAMGTTFFWEGELQGLGRDAAALNNVSKVEEGRELVAGGTVIDSVDSVWQDPAGAWYVRADFADGTGATNTDFILRNGVIVAKRYEPIAPGSTLTWDRASTTSTLSGFLQTVGNAQGHYFIAGGVLDGASRVSAGVLDGQTIVIKRGDPVDVDGDGLADDSAFVQGFSSETGAGKAFLTDSGQLWLDINLMNSGGTGIGRAIVRMQLNLGTPCAADFNGVGGVTVADIFAFLSAWFANDPAADFNLAGGVTVADIFAFLSAWFAGCP